MTPSGLRLVCKEISEDDDAYGHFVKYCRRYWGKQMMDYGTTSCPKADQYIIGHKPAWRKQAERSETDSTDEDESGSIDPGDKISDGDTRMSGVSDDQTENSAMKTDDQMGSSATDTDDQMESSPTNTDDQMESSPTKTDYHESCHLLHARPEAETGKVKDPILIRAEYRWIYDRLKCLNTKGYKAVVTGQPGIGNSPYTVSYVVNTTN